MLLLEAAVALSVGLASRLTSSSTSHEVVASPRTTASRRALASIHSSLDHDVGRNIGHPSWPLDCHVLSFGRGSQGIARPLLAVIFVVKLGSLTANVVHNPSVALVPWVDGIRSPQLVALLVLLRYTEAGLTRWKCLRPLVNKKSL